MPVIVLNDSDTEETEGEEETEEEETEEILSSEALGTKLVLKGRRKKLLVKEVTVAQWIGANQRIFAKLYPLFTESELIEYGEYVEQISELFSQYPVANVMRVDDIHRKEVSIKGHSWNHVRVFLQIHWLSKNMSRPVANATPSGGRGATSERKEFPSRRLCTEFNDKGSCRYGSACRFRHVCSIAGCSEKHPACKHELPSSSFRNRGDQNAADAAGK